LKSTLHPSIFDINLAALNPFLQEANLKCIKTFIDYAEILWEIGHYAQGRSVMVGLENLPPAINTPLIRSHADHTCILKEINHDNVRATFDLGHAFLCGLDLNVYLEEIKPLVLCQEQGDSLI